MNEDLSQLHDLQVMARYNRWANRRLYECVATLDDETYRQDRDAFFGSIHATLNHILVGDRVWTCRLVGEYSGIKSLDQILHESFEELRIARQTMDEQLIATVDRLAAGEDGGLDKEVRYRTVSDGEKHTSPAHHIFLTLFNHQTHHRGQVHCMLTQSGVNDPPALDVIFMLRDMA